jgi:hypothetical protein
VSNVRDLDHKFSLGAGGATVVDKLEGFAGDEVYTVHGKGKGQRFSPSQKFTPSLLSTWYGLAPLALILTCCD